MTGKKDKLGGALELETEAIWLCNKRPKTPVCWEKFVPQARASRALLTGRGKATGYENGVL